MNGIPMGSSFAVMLATISYGYHERKNIIGKFTENLHHYRRYIDDGIGIWIPTQDNDEQWEVFVKALHGFGHLMWDIHEPSLTVD